jgi:zinc transport system substrate-binding protein
MKKTVWLIVGALMLIIGGYFVFNNQEKSLLIENVKDKEKLAIVTSFYPLQFAVERIIGGHGTVVNIGESRDPHNFEPSTQDMITLQRADLVVLQGAEFEPWGDDVIASLEANNIPVIIATDNLKLHEGGHNHEEEESREDEDGHEHGAYDPHTWLDPILFSETVGYLTEKIAALDPNNAKLYQENASTLQAELASLDIEYANKLANCELDDIITSHEAFGYLAERYNFSTHSIAGLSTQDTPSITTMAELREEAQKGIGAILLEENSIAAYGETLAHETGLATLSINPISYIIPANENYLTLMRENLNVFATGLKCNE